VARNAGKHAGGVVIAPGPLTDFTPLYTDPRTGSVVTQFDKNDVESVGLVKFDFPRPQEPDHHRLGDEVGESSAPIAG
jgi:hypothetical protein